MKEAAPKSPSGKQAKAKSPATFASQRRPQQEDSDSSPTMGYAATAPSLAMGKTLTAGIAPKLDKLKLLGRYHSLPRKLEDDYTVSESVLGSGFSGDVRLCHAISSGQKFAVKTLNMAHATPVVWAKMQSELQVSLSVDHPHLVRLINVYEAEDSFNLVMEFLEGGTLAQSMKEGEGKPEAEVAQITKQLMLAVGYLHSHGIVHRDLKPENFVYQSKSDKHLKMIDFGFSKFRDDKDMLLSRCGSPAFAAPEIFAGKGYTNQVDMWSLGVIVFNLLVGYLPVSTKSKDQLNRMRASCQRLSALARDFTKQMMQQDAAQRITVFDALQHPWMREHGVHVEAGGDRQIDGNVVTSLQSYGRASRLRRCFLSAVAKTISDEKVSQLREAFVSLDGERSGLILGTDVGAKLINAGTPACDVETIVDALDVDKDGEIDFSEFMAAALSATPDFSDESLHLAFRNFDFNQTGRVTRENLQEVLGDDFMEDYIPEQGLDFAAFCNFMRQPMQSLPAPVHGPLKKLKGSSSRDPRRASLIGLRDHFAYHERYVVVSGLQVRWWRREQKSSDSTVAQRIIDLTVNEVELALVKENPSRFELRNKNGAWQGESLDNVERGRPFVFDTAGSKYSCQEWMDAILAHATFAKENAIREAAQKSVVPVARLTTIGDSPLEEFMDDSSDDESDEEEASRATVKIGKCTATVKADGDIDVMKVLEAKPFKEWVDTIAMEGRMEVSAIHIQSLDLFGAEVGFIKFKADVSVDGKQVPGIVFMRGGAVAILVVLRCESQLFTLVVRQPRVSIGLTTMAEIPAGMFDDDGNFAGVAAKKMKEETGIEIKQSDLVDLTQSAYRDRYPGVFPSCGSSNEFRRIFFFRKMVTAEELASLKGKLDGVAEEGEMIRLDIMPLESLWRKSPDSKALVALQLYEKVLAAGGIPEA